MIEARDRPAPRSLTRPLACRHCGARLTTVFADLGETPVANDFLTCAALEAPEPRYPLKAYVCGDCRLVQLQDFLRAGDVFRADYAYFSSISASFLRHASRYADAMCERFSLGAHSRVVEVASNDGYLLQYFKAKRVPVLGVEPCGSVAESAIRDRGVPTRIEFFGRETARRLVSQGYAADLAIANNVLGHVPDINDFVEGLHDLLKPEGVATAEFPSLLNLIRFNQFDTIYHEHFSYLSLFAAERIAASNGLRLFDVDEIDTHGGSLRLYFCRSTSRRERSARATALLEEEGRAGLDRDDIYLSFMERADATKRALRDLLCDIRRSGRTIAGYGAPAKGNTLLNYCGIGRDIVGFTVDRSPHKQGLYLPGSHIPILAPEAIDAARPDFVLILPWNLKDEITTQLNHLRERGARFIIPIPKPEIL